MVTFFPSEKRGGARKCAILQKHRERRQDRGSRKGTTTNRHGTKTSTTFCDFLLTGISQAKILQLQIRGNVEAPADRVEDVHQSPGATKPARVLSKKIEREI
jgi:hypothetical protein